MEGEGIERDNCANPVIHTPAPRDGKVAPTFL